MTKKIEQLNVETSKSLGSSTYHQTEIENVEQGFVDMGVKVKRAKSKRIKLYLVLLLMATGLVVLGVGSVRTIQYFETTINGHEFVDLGLSVKWATCNLGATTPSKSGDEYAWGEIEPMIDLSEPSSSNICAREVGDIGGTNRDAATMKWGGGWRMPSKEEFEELIECCKWECVLIHNNWGYRITGPNGNSIYLPSDGCCLFEDGPSCFCGNYWSSTPCDSTGSAWNLFFEDNGRVIGLFGGTYCDYRDYKACMIRPVSE